ncbi:hypothetical protein N7478_001559 [Penicillium angulare]|uniref:uncharacterized protein n=1 Tax=Penicillium angulare TaxID=116970 RepID=UPI0025412481|nr:uncharacterized protein N7478_001559 [Penicillium angulare]KAJ5288529.1 hypothetical protein N7478_001559 [Penicillium angulare]
MPTKDFRADLQGATVLRRYPHLSQITQGEYEGSISFHFHHPRSGTDVTFDVVTSDISDYPTDHSFVVFVKAGSVVPSATKALERAQDQGLLTGISIDDVLKAVDRIMCHALCHSGPKSSANSEESEESEDEYENDYEDVSDDEVFEGSAQPPLQQSRESCCQKLRADLRTVKCAGFRVGCINEAEGTIIVAISRRVSQLGISEEALQTWNVLPSEYLVLLVRYPRQYQNMQDIFNMHESAAKSIEMRVGLCTSYKPNPLAAIKAFHMLLKLSEGDVNASNTLNGNSMVNFRALFIGSALKRLLNERFLGILQIREKSKISWTGAELFFQAVQGQSLAAEDCIDARFHVPDSWLSPPPSVLISDHFAETGLDVTKASFLLVAWQFTMRHFVKCTEFCLVCHCKTFDNFEALKPYVCSNGLCLYQYVNYGMGPSLEYEIQSQPLVVDFLISLTYARAISRRLEDFPDGLGIRVPSLLDEGNEFMQSVPRQPITMAAHWEPRTHDKGWLHAPTMNLTCCHAPKVAIGSWIVVIDIYNKDATGRFKILHCQVDSIVSPTSFVLSRPFALDQQIQLQDTLFARREVQYVPYGQNFDDLTPMNKQRAMVMLLDTLPDVKSMKKFLGPIGSQITLSSWHGRIIPAALDFLRWIVASNRSSILQDGEDLNHLVTGMQGYAQFRLVQGAPDKEQRFIQAVKSVSLPASPNHPTIFAWHGSPVYNWHSILREGFHFKQIANGRACGNGVYMSSHFSTAMGYTRESDTGAASRSWPNSALDLRCVVSLNEIVNKTDEFVCCNPHFVVQNLEWIQPRYLFVGTSDALKSRLPAVENHGNMSVSVYNQDPKHPAHGPDRKIITIPLSAASSQRQRMIVTASIENTSRNPVTKQNIMLSPQELTDKPITFNSPESCASISTATDDLNLLCSDSEANPGRNAKTPTGNEKPSFISSPEPATDFVPGTLTEDSLPQLAQPQYATRQATTILQRHLKSTLAVQSAEPLAELGWYVYPNLIKTVYQWIVELHSFDPSLPLAKDLKSVNIQSVVIELRFPQQFPMSPPFVRVIRPRFLEFAFGGGGHVTAGGAMCMELLTNTGWSPATSIESVLLQVRMAISATEPRPARLAPGGHQRDYSVNEATMAFKRACLNHGWEVPKDMELTSW